MRWRSAASTSQSDIMVSPASAAKQATREVFPVPPFPLITTSSFGFSPEYVLYWTAFSTTGAGLSALFFLFLTGVFI